MRPCEVCGGMGIDAAGYCTQCRTYRGLPQAPTPGYPGGEYPGPTSGAPYPGPVSGGPYPAAQGPASGAPYPGGQPGGGYPPGRYPGDPGMPPPAQLVPQPVPAASRRNSFVVPLVALSATLVVLVVAIVTVVAINAGKDEPVGPGGTPTAGALVDSCVVGTWRVVSHEEDVAFDDGKVRFTGNGTEIRLKDDGTGVTDYKGGTTFTGTTKNRSDGSTVSIKLVFSGKIAFDYRAKDGTLSFSNPRPDGTVKTIVNGTELTSEPLSGSEDPARYTCSGDKLVESTAQYRVEMRRTG